MGNAILEVGSGIGNISRLLPKKEHLIVTDVDQIYLDILQVAFGDMDIVRVVKLDIRKQEDVHALGGEGICDTIVCLNVLEHIEDDQKALKHMHDILVPGGNVVLLVPQYKWLFGSYDRHAGHFRRYNRKELKKKLDQANFRVVWYKNFNSLGLLGWLVNSCLLQRKAMDRWQLKIYDLLVPLLRIIEGLLPLPGLSLICVAEKLPSTRN
jgi:SAM-dependent methyltransferase